MAKAKMSVSYSPQLQEAIRRRATELFRRSGAVPGHDLENWCQAELEILQEHAAQLVRPAVVIRFEGVLYTCEYESAAVGSYTPGEWKPGESVPLRIAGDKVYLRRHDGSELETIITKRVTQQVYAARLAAHR
ncbi:MAG: DUF2934 domain-containing protein [Candidatus Sulfotelmatobacter sp.]